MTNSIVFTGGGTAGHVTPNLPLMDFFSREGWRVEYIGSEDGIEKDLIEPTGFTFHTVKNGKLRRYFSFRNVTDPLKIIIGIGQAYRLLRKNKPQVVFSKGGFVAFPVVVGAWLNRIPVVAHESDISPGLANKLCIPFVHTLCVTFEATRHYIVNKRKVIVTGTPLRDALFQGNREKGLALCGFVPDKPCLLVMGGGSGAESINNSIRAAMPDLVKQFQVIHLCGKGKMDTTIEAVSGYKQFDYVNKELPDLFACADMVVSRSGANSLYEILALAKPHVLIPLSARISRGDQIHNARYFEKQGISRVIDDEKLNTDILMQEIIHVMTNKAVITEKIQALGIRSATEQITQIIQKVITMKNAPFTVPFLCKKRNIDK